MSPPGFELGSTCHRTKFYPNKLLLLPYQLYCWMTGISTTIDLFSDSTGAIALCTNPVGRARHKHVDLADHYARELFEAGIITISFVPTDDMVADIFTKALPEAKFKKFTKIIMGR